MLQSNLSLKVQGDSILNPTHRGESLPVVLTVYQLTDDHLFQQANFQSLWKQDTQVLADTFISKKEIQINPGEHKNIQIRQDDRANFVAVMGIFITPDNHFRDVLPLHRKVPGFTKQIQVIVEGNHVKLVG